MTQNDANAYDVVVSGGGLSGLAAALAFAAEGLSVLCVERRAAPAAAHGAAATAPIDVRTAAILQPSIAFLERIGVWPRAAPMSTPLRTMRLIDVDRGGQRPRKLAPFQAQDIGQGSFGANIANADLLAALRDAVAAAPDVTLRAPATIARAVRRDDAVHLTLDDGARIQAALLVGADGRDSAVRRQLGVSARRVAFGQSAIVTVLAHDAPHRNMSTEIHRTGGPFTLVPHLDGPEGGPRSGLVWMESNAAADGLMAAPDDVFAAHATERSLGVLGPLRAAGPRMRYPIISLLADRFWAKRAALIAEAAHVTPPIGAQGLNMSLRDAETLASLAGDARRAGQDIGSDAVLARYARQRWPDVAARVVGVSALNAAAIGPLKPIRDIRKAALSALYDLPGLRAQAMRIGLGR